MILKSFVPLFVIFSLGVNGSEYTYDSLAGGWLKLHDHAPWTDASVICETEDAVLASPFNSQIRNAIRAFVFREDKCVTRMFTGVQADFDTGDYYSVEGVSLTKMPVLVQVEQNEPNNYNGTESCVEWMINKDEVAYVKCTELKPFVCFKKRKTVVVAGCGTRDPEYSYNAQSGSCYKFHRKGQDWMKAYKTCKKEGGYLAIINSPLEHRVLLKLFAKYPSKALSISAGTSGDYAYMGIRRWEITDHWKTVINRGRLEDAGFNEWVSGEPMYVHGNENCGTLYRKGNYSNTDCKYEYAFICEKSPEILYK